MRGTDNFYNAFVTCRRCDLQRRRAGQGSFGFGRQGRVGSVALSFWVILIAVAIVVAALRAIVIVDPFLGRVVHWFRGGRGKASVVIVIGAGAFGSGLGFQSAGVLFTVLANPPVAIWHDRRTCWWYSRC